VRSILQDIDGVEQIRIDLATHRVSVSYDPGLTDPEAMVQALDAGGYPVQGKPRRIR
jgi:copper chaperone CopZ